MPAVKKPLPNQFKVERVEIDGKIYVKMGNPCHGPIPADDAMLWAARMAMAAQPGARLKLGALLNRLVEEENKALPEGAKALPAKGAKQ